MASLTSRSITARKALIAGAEHEVDAGEAELDMGGGENDAA
jgi:hypothetical protein